MASHKYRRALIEGTGLCSESTVVISAVVKREEIGQEGDEDTLEGTERSEFRRLATTPNDTSQDGSDVQCRTSRRWQVRHEEVGKGLK